MTRAPAGAPTWFATSPATVAPQHGDVGRPPLPARSDGRHGDRRGALGEADGAVPDGVTVFDDQIPAVANLDPGLLKALRRAAADAAADGVEFTVVSGDAIDIGPTAAAGWLSEHGADHGLCQIYRNEPWHFELRTDAADRGCPRPYADPTHDPRMQQ